MEISPALLRTYLFRRIDLIRAMCVYLSPKLLRNHFLFSYVITSGICWNLFETKLQTRCQCVSQKLHHAIDI